MAVRPRPCLHQLYLHDPVASVVLPVQRLRGFERVTLQPGERRRVQLALKAPDLALLDADLRWTVEPGVFEVRVGASSRDVRLTGRFEVLP
ncbi:MAG: fibronectin type III-like domain-contianing protein [Betaproteobacteria bacterium]